jgi:hypothetical protein
VNGRYASLVAFLARLCGAALIAGAGVFAVFAVVSEIWFYAASLDCASASLPLAGMPYILLCLLPTPIVFIIATVAVYNSRLRIRAAHLVAALAVVACTVLSFEVFGRFIHDCNPP